MTTGDVLYVDADREARFAVSRFLRRAAPTRDVASLSDARVAVLDKMPALLVIDPTLPDGDGHLLIDELHAREPWVQIFVVLGPDRAEETSVYIAAGASDVVVKPFDVGGLGARVKRLLAEAEKSKKELEYRQQLEQRLRHAERIATLGTLCATVAHEVANPLSLILTNASVIQRAVMTDPAFASLREATDESQREAFELIAEASKDVQIAGDMIDAFITRIRLFSRRNEEKRAEVALAEVVDTALLLLRPRLSARRVRVERPKGAAPIASHFPTRLTQALINVIHNAIEAGPDGGTITIDYVARPESIGIIVDDEGSGIPPSIDITRSEAFFTTKPNGTGLGLLVIRTIMQEHGGRFDLVPRADGQKGTRARLLLPRDPEAPLLPS